MTERSVGDCIPSFQVGGAGLTPAARSITSFRGEYRLLSNFYPWRDSSLEHYYQAAKAEYSEQAQWVLQAKTPGEAKRRGRMITIRKDWESIKVQVMRNLLVEKFSLEPFKTWLKNTGDVELVEGNNWNDTFWGVCKGQGMNHLGRLLMEIRGGVC